MKPNHKAQNASITFLGEKVELFFQAVNCDHIAENYFKLFSTHNVKFVEIVNLLKGDVFIDKVPKSHKYFIISKYKGDYYKCIATLDKRTDLNNKYFLVVISCYICKNKAEIIAYENYSKETKDHYRK